jgi:hypothetical protein
MRIVSIFAISLTACAVLASGSAQEPGTPMEETVASLAAGRVVIAVVKDAILVATVENPIEADTHPPLPVAISSDRIGVILGAVRWSSPSTQQQIAWLDQELPHLRGRTVAETPKLGGAQGGTEATDIESIGQGMLERLNQVAQGLHGKVDLPENDPLAELIVADYHSNYGPEVWQLTFGIKQIEEETDYWTTRVLRPSYLQFWPPEKGQPRTLVEFAYPPENAPTPLLDLLRQGDPRVAKIVSSDPKMTDVANHLLGGESNKIVSADAIQFLRAALDAVAPPNARETMASIREETGFAWILPPPAEPKPALPAADRPADAPTLMPPPK